MPDATSPLPVFDARSLDGRVAVVTGAAGGLGAAIARRLAGMGAAVVRVDRRAPAPDDGHRADAIACDITDPAAISAMAGQVARRYGRCDVLVNNAGIKTAPVPLEDLPLADWDSVFNVNVRGALLCAQALAPMMLAQQCGSIVNIASIGAQWPTRVGAYGASKAALCGLTRQMANEWGPRGVRANSVSPGMVRTPMSDGYYRDPDRAAARLAMLPLRRLGEPGDIADAVAFLASDAARFITGQDLVADGGLLVAPLFNAQAPSR
ncbi:SDR family NAD(P)-dependent oxidoreductase [Bordetella petrii]|uniref:SDR family NAD(P)-dependent oxidoreductase n=1 Tax=Bordetella petrii TaxID=94624 RepID=UPI001E50002B|nr:SDR family oxidoreductase [Bordetella petrii]MCD0503804.1 SDR family oxidoreductase [Bordetella petrii]